MCNPDQKDLACNSYMKGSYQLEHSIQYAM